MVARVLASDLGLASADIFGRGDHVELALALQARVEGAGAGPVIFDEGALYEYVGETGLYRSIDVARQSRIVQSFAGATITTTGKRLSIKASDVAGAIKLASHRATHPNFFADAPHGLVFADGFVTVTADRIGLKPHDRDHRARLGYPFAYTTANAPALWLQFLDALFRDDADKHEKIACIQEHAGACLLGIATRYQRALVLVGKGGEGKSTSTEIITSAMPSGSTCAIPPQEWSQEYRRAMLAGKLMNVVAELPEADIIASEAFKATITGDPMTGRHIRDTPFTFAPKAGHIFAANRLPGTADQTEGFWRRVLVVRFNRSFTNDPMRDPKIAERIIKVELPSIVVWMLEGAKRLLGQRDYTMPESHFGELRDWRRNADQVALFVDERTRPSKAARPLEPPHDWTRATTLYASYRSWAERNGHRALASNKFGGRLRDLGYPVQRTEVGALYALSLATDEPDAGLTDSRIGPSAKTTGGPNGCA